MPELTINGRCQAFEIIPANLSELVAQLNVSPLGLIVEKNGTVFKEAEFSSVVLADGDVLEFLRFMGGGSCPKSSHLHHFCPAERYPFTCLWAFAIGFCAVTG